MESSRDKLTDNIVLVAMLGIVIATLANEAHESVRCLGIIAGFGVLIAAFVYGALREA